jgi:hypothetical protein
MVTVTEIVAAHRSGAVTPAQTIRRCFERIRALADPGIFIGLRDEKAVLAEAEALSIERSDGPLCGVPAAVKDNIDVAGLPTVEQVDEIGVCAKARIELNRIGKRASGRREQRRLSIPAPGSALVQQYCCT